MVLKNDGGLEAVRQDKITLLPSQGLSGKGFVFMVVVSDDGLDPDTPHRI
jgi:hypothetical protein